MSRLVYIAKFLWTFPVSLGAYNRKGDKLGEWEGYPVYQVRFWASGFSTAAWPVILLSPWAVKHFGERVRFHEAEHIRQQLRFSGIGFLLSYGVFWLYGFFRYGLRWKKAYKGVLYERSARIRASRMMEWIMSRKRIFETDLVRELVVAFPQWSWSCQPVPGGMAEWAVVGKKGVEKIEDSFQCLDEEDPDDKKKRVLEGMRNTVFELEGLLVPEPQVGSFSTERGQGFQAGYLAAIGALDEDPGDPHDKARDVLRVRFREVVGKEVS